MKKIVLIILAFVFINFTYAEECPVLSNYVEHTYYVHDDKENNFVEFDIYADKQIIPVYIYIDKPYVQQMFVLNLTQKKDKRYFDHVKLNLKDTIVSEIYLNKPGIYPLLITTDPYYYNEDISNLCMPQPPSLSTYEEISKNNEELLRFLRSETGIDFTEDAKIEKKGNEIKVKEGDNEVIIYEKENEMILKVIGGITKKYILKEENDKLYIYNYPCNVLPHPCSKTDRILTNIKVVSKDKNKYGIIYKLVGLKDINESVTYLEKEIPMENFTKEYKWKVFLLSNSSALKDENIKEKMKDATEVNKKFTDAVVVEGTVYDHNANVVKGAGVGIYLVGIEPNVIHIFTVTDENGKFKIYYKPAGEYIYRLPKIIIVDYKNEMYYSYEGLTDSVDMKKAPKKEKEPKEFPFPVELTLIVLFIVGAILTLFGTGYLKMPSKKKEHEH